VTTSVRRADRVGGVPGQALVQQAQRHREHHRDQDDEHQVADSHRIPEVGHVDELLIDDTEKRVRFLRVAAGGFLGIGGQKFLIPVDAITAIAPDTVRVDRSRDHVAAAPGPLPAKEIAAALARAGELVPGVTVVRETVVRGAGGRLSPRNWKSRKKTEGKEKKQKKRKRGVKQDKE